MAAFLPHIGVATVVTPPLVYGATKLQDFVHTTLKRKYPDSPWTQSKQLKLDTKLRHSAMAFRMRRRRFGRRRRFRRTFRKRSSFRARRFKRRVKSIMLKTLEPRKIDNVTSTDLSLQEGDGTSRLVYVMNPASAIMQGAGAGTADRQISGNQFWLKGIGFRGSFHMSTTTPVATSCIVRVSLVKSKINATTMSAGFVTFGNTTTAITNPTQVPPFANPEFFETTGNQAFTGDGYIIPFDKTKVKVLKSYSIPVNPSGDVEGTEFSMPTPFNLWFPINRKMQIQDPLEGTINQELGFKWGSYYLVMQVIASAQGTQSDEVVICAHRVSTYFRDF